MSVDTDESQSSKGRQEREYVMTDKRNCQND